MASGVYQRRGEIVIEPEFAMPFFFLKDWQS